MALPPGCTTVCRPRRSNPRIYSPSDLKRIARYVLESHGEQEVCDAIRAVVRCCEIDCGDAKQDLDQLDEAVFELRRSGVLDFIDQLIEILVPFVAVFRFRPGRRLGRLQILANLFVVIEAVAEIAGLITAAGEGFLTNVQKIKAVIDLYNRTSNDVRRVLNKACKTENADVDS